MVTDEMVEKAMLSLYGSDFYDNWDRNTSFVVNREVGMRAALEAALSAAEPVEQEDYKALFEECQLARDEIGFLGSVPDCIRYLDAEAKAAPPAPSVAVKAREIVDAIFDDLRGRRFLKWVFDARGSDCYIGDMGGEKITGLDLDVQDEIKIQWSSIIASALSAQVQDVAGLEAVAKAAQAYVDAVSGEPEKDCWDTVDGKEAPGAERFASDWAWKHYDNAKQEAFDNLRAMLAAAPAAKQATP